MRVEFHELGSICDQRLDFAVIGAQLDGQWVFVKHRQRNTWEIPGGHREPGEGIERTAARELVEETGAVEFELNALCEYSVIKDKNSSYGRLFLASIKKLGPLPVSEIGEVRLFRSMPMELTYPAIQPSLQRRLEQMVRHI